MTFVKACQRLPSKRERGSNLVTGLSTTVHKFLSFFYFFEVFQNLTLYQMKHLVVKNSKSSQIGIVNMTASN